MKSIVILLVFAAALLQACGQGGLNRKRGRYCTTKTDPIPLEIKTKKNSVKRVSEKSMDLTADTDPQVALPPGTYVYNKSDIFFRRLQDEDGDGAREEMTELTAIHVVHGKGRNDKWDFGNGCVRTTTSNRQPFTVGFKGVTRFTVTESNQFVIDEVKEFSFTFTGAEVVHNLVSLEKDDYDSLRKVYVLENGSTKLWQVSPNKGRDYYDIRTVVTEDNLQRSFAVRYQFVPPGEEIPATP